jgi:hypothetical protein
VTGLTYHNVMGETLPQRAAPTISAERDRAKEHLRPPEHRERLADEPVRAHGPGPQRPLVDVQLEVHAERELRRNRKEQHVRERAVRALEETAAAVGVPEYVAA